MGGTCTNTGCVPTKALLACSKAYRDLKRLKRFGISADAASFDFAAMKRHQAQIVRTSALGVQKSLRDLGVELFEGEAHVISSSEVESITAGKEKRRIGAKNILLAWGSESSRPGEIALSRRILDSEGFLALERLPRSAVVVGAGSIGVEFATFLAELGSRITIIELSDQILPLEDREGAIFLEGELRRIGVEVSTSTRLDSICEFPDGVRIRAFKEQRVIELQAELAVICTGRRPFLLKNELDNLGIRHGKGGIEIDGHQATNIPGIFAVGDVTGGTLLAHRASMQGKTLASFLFADGSFTYQEGSVPSVTYSHPNLARVGLTEERARAQGQHVEMLRAEFGANILARAELRGAGFVKMIFIGERLAGATIVGEEAAELIAPMGLAVASGLEKKNLRAWVIAHPSLSEIFSLP